MNASTLIYDVLVLGSGPAGQKAAVQAAKAGRRVAVVEQDAAVGGACVRHGTIPSKTLRETTMVLASFRRRSGDVLSVSMPENVKLASLMTRLDDTVRGHQAYMGEQLRRNGIEVLHGRARFVEPHEIEVLGVDRTRRRLGAGIIVLAVGSRPRVPAHVPIDHETVLDSDSILSLTYLPPSLTILGAGVIGCEYGCIFANLGVTVTMIDGATRPLSFLDPELTDRFQRRFEAAGGRFIGGVGIAAVRSDGFAVRTELTTGEVVTADKLLCAAGRVAAVERLELGAAGLATNARGLLDVDAHGRTAVPHIYAVGDVVGPPALAASAMDQGRRAVCHALGLDPGPAPEATPIGIYTIPEMASVGITEAEATTRPEGVLVGRADFHEIARGHIINDQDGLLKLIADGAGRRVLGIQIIGESATELIHLGQITIALGGAVDTFVENIFNFPTLAEAYRVAALDIIGQRQRRPTTRHAARRAVAECAPSAPSS
jgi:NAD(P) transhydrogenase